MKRIEKAISRLMPEIAGKRVLEPACGCAEFSIAAAAYAAEGVCFDLDDKRLHSAALQTPRLSFEIMDATSMQFPEACFDTVVLYNAIGHLEEIAESVLRECLRVVNTFGAVWIVSSFRMDKAVIQQTVKPLLDQMKLEHTLQDDGTFTYLRISAAEAKGNLIRIKRELSGRILDIGGGGEGVIGRVYGPQVTAIDISAEELAEAPEGFEKLVMDAGNMTFPDASFDHVTAFYSFLFIPKDRHAQAISEIARVLRPGGEFYIWDCEVASAYPEPFTVELDIDANGVPIHTTYGILEKGCVQTAEGLIETCAKAGLRLCDVDRNGTQFYLRFRKGETNENRCLPIRGHGKHPGQSQSD